MLRKIVKALIAGLGFRPSSPCASEESGAVGLGMREEKATGRRLRLGAVAASVVGILASVLLGGAYYRMELGQIRGEYARTLGAIADLKSDEISSWRKERIGDVLVLSHALGLSEAVLAMDKGKEQASLAQDLRAWLRSYCEHYGYLGAGVFGHDLKPLVVAPSGVERALESALGAEIGNTLRASKGAVMGEVRDFEGGAIPMGFMAAIREPETDGFCGAALLVADVEGQLCKIAARTPPSARNIDVLLVARRGGGAVWLNRPLGGGAVGALPERSSAADGLLAAISSGSLQKGGVFEGSGPQGRDVVAVAVRVTDTAWTVVCTADSAAVIAPARIESVKVTLGVAVILAVLGWGLRLRWAQREILLVERRAAADKAAAEMTHRLGLVLQHARDAILLFDDEMRVVEANQRASNIYERSAGEMVGLSALDLRAPEARESAQPDFQSVRSSSGVTFETTHVSKGGRHFPVEVSSCPVIIKGKPHVLSIVRDIAWRKDAEDMLIRRNELLNAVFSQAVDSIVVIEADTGRFVEFNAAAHECLGYSREEFAVMGIAGIQAEHSKDQIEANIQRIRAEGGAVFETFHRHRSGELRNVRVSVRWLAVRGRSLMVSIWTDITERRRLEEDLRQAQKLEAVGQLAGGVSHDFNNILAAMMLQISLLQSEPQMARETKQALSELSSEARRAASLTRQLLMFSRRSVLSMRPLSLNEVVGNLLKMLGRLIGEHIQLHFESDGKLPAVEADAGMLEQVLVNLVVNARDAMPKGGRIVIETSVVEFDDTSAGLLASRRAGTFTCIAVSDTGVGMDETTLKRIFEPYFTTKEAGKGTGLGLATVHGIVAQHRGWVEVRSKPGQGSVFQVYLPVCDETRLLDLEPETESPIPRGTENILLVEDEPRLRVQVGNVLRGLGYGVFEAANVSDALALWRSREGRFDLLLTDVVMPGGATGLELAEQLLAMKPGLKVVVSSGYSQEISSGGAPRGNGITYFPKPYEAEGLARWIRESLDQVK